MILLWLLLSVVCLIVCGLILWLLNIIEWMGWRLTLETSTPNGIRMLPWRSWSDWQTGTQEGIPLIATDLPLVAHCGSWWSVVLVLLLHLDLTKLIGIADLWLHGSSSSNRIRMLVLMSRRLCEAGSHLLVVLIQTVPFVDRPGVESISGDLSVLLVYPPDALHIVGYARVQELVAGGMASLAAPLIVGAPEKIADLEQAVVGTAIRVESSHSRRVEGGLVLGYAHPGGDLWHGKLVLVVEFLGQLTATVDLSLGLDLRHLLVVIRGRVAVDLNLLWFLVGGCHCQGTSTNLLHSTSRHVRSWILAVGGVGLPGRESIATDPLMLRIDLPHAQNIVGDVVVPQPGTTHTTTLALARWRAPVDVTDLE